jgi:hypothetical protein
MTMPDERTRALLLTERFLTDLINPSKTAKVPKNIREHARMLLRHYPSSHDVALVNMAWDEPIVRFTLNCPFEHPDKVQLPDREK